MCNCKENTKVIVEMEKGFEEYFPKKAHVGDACYDLYSTDSYNLYPGEHKLFHTGVHVQFQSGYELIVRGRSGMALKGIYTHVGTVDSNYRNEIGVILYNTTERPYNINKGDRIAQMQLQKIPSYELVVGEVDENKERGNAGFGSSGK